MSNAWTNIAKEITASAGVLAGKKIAVKDNICTKDLPLTAASRTLAHYRSPYDATVVHQLKAAGAHIAGKTNLDEFGMGSHTQFSFFGPSAHPLDPLRSPGGSSGGSAIAVAKNDCFAALATDTGGSVRLPASYCGVIGLKPSYGRFSRFGVVSYANSLDTVGILARDLPTLRVVYTQLDGYDEQDPTCMTPSTRAELNQLHKTRDSGVRIGIPYEFHTTEMASTVGKAWETAAEKLERLGYSVVPVSIPIIPHALATYYILAPAEASSNLAKYDGVRYGHRSNTSDSHNTMEAHFSSRFADEYAQTRGESFGREVRRRILLGNFVLSAEAYNNYFVQAQRVRRLLSQDFDGTFRTKNIMSTCNPNDNGVDVLLSPTSTTTAPLLSNISSSSATEDYMSDSLTVPASLAGIPAMSLPFCTDEQGLSIGLSLTAQYGCEDHIFQVAESMLSVD